MTETDKREEICQKYPKLFGDRSIYFECNDGWLDLIDKLCECIQIYYEENLEKRKEVAPPRVSQIKEKYGTLRFYIDGGDQRIEGMIWFAKHLSGSICEVTGRPGRLRKNGGGWFMTLCDEEAAKHGYMDA